MQLLDPLFVFVCNLREKVCGAHRKCPYLVEVCRIRHPFRFLVEYVDHHDDYGLVDLRGILSEAGGALSSSVSGYGELLLEQCGCYSTSIKTCAASTLTANKRQ